MSSKKKNSSDDNNNSNNDQKKGLSKNQKKTIKVGAAVVGTTLAAYGTYKLSKITKQKAYEKNIYRGYKAVAKLLADKRNTHIETGMGLYDKKDSFVANRLFKNANRYAERHSKTTAEAVKTLLGKNSEFTLAELINMGVKVSDII